MILHGLYLTAVPIPYSEVIRPVDAVTGATTDSDDYGILHEVHAVYGHTRSFARLSPSKTCRCSCSVVAAIADGVPGRSLLPTLQRRGSHTGSLDVGSNTSLLPTMSITGN